MGKGDDPTFLLLFCSCLCAQALDWAPNSPAVGSHYYCCYRLFQSASSNFPPRARKPAPFCGTGNFVAAPPHPAPLDGGNSQGCQGSLDGLTGDLLSCPLPPGPLEHGIVFENMNRTFVTKCILKVNVTIPSAKIT